MAGRRKPSTKAKRFEPQDDAGARRRGGGGLVPWLILGAVGLLAALWRRGERRPALPAAEPAPSEPVPAETPPSFELPEGTDEAWIPGPAGSLRVARVNPAGGLAVVFVHGLGGCLEHWAPMLHAAGPGMHAVAFDLPGHGGSDPSLESAYTVPDLAAALGAVLDNLDLRQVVLMGHSLGASVAAEYAGRHRNRVQGLLLVDPNGDQTRLPAEQRRQLVAALEKDPRAELGWQFRQVLHGSQPEVADRILQDLEATDARVLLATLVASLDYSPLEPLTTYGGPVSSVVSDLNDLPHSLHRLRPELPVRFLGGSSHWLMLDRFDELWEELIDFLDLLRG